MSPGSYEAEAGTPEQERDYLDGIVKRLASLAPVAVTSALLEGPVVAEMLGGHAAIWAKALLDGGAPQQGRQGGGHARSHPRVRRPPGDLQPHLRQGHDADSVLLIPHPTRTAPDSPYSYERPPIRCPSSFVL
jgi:hypothetical protein